MRRLAILCALTGAASGCTLILSFDQPPDGGGAPPDQSVPDLSVPDLALLDLAGADLACPSGCGGDLSWKMCCSGACVDTSSDPNNCGGCGKVCASGRCGLALPPLAPGSWSFNKDATPTDGGARLTPSLGDLTGTVFYTNLIPVDDVTTNFRLRITPDAGCAGGVTTGDGVAWAIQTSAPNAVGSGRGHFGVVDLPGYAVEIDTFDEQGCDRPIDHAAIDWTDAPCDAGTPVMLDVYNNGMGGGTHWLANCQWHSCVVTLKSGTLSVTIDGQQALSATLTNLAAGYYVGFGGGTGSYASEQEVDQVSVTFSAPSCL